MASITEKSWPSIILTPFTVVDSRIVVSSTKGLHPKQVIYLAYPGLTSLECEIKRVSDSTHLLVGAPNSGIKNQYDQTKLSPYDGGTLTAYEQNRNPIGMEPVIRAVYEEEPTIAFRNILVDQNGSYYDSTNPLPVQLQDGSIKIETVHANLAVQISAKDNDPIAGDIHDSVRIGDGINEMAVNLDGSINVRTDVIFPVGMLAIGTENGTISGTQHVAKIDSNLDLAVKDTLSLVKLTSIDGKLTSPLTINLPSNASTATNQVTGNNSLASIDSKLTNPLPISGTVTATIGDLNASKDDVMIAGSENGLSTGTVRHFVNNVKNQILASHNREQDITYADFGTINQRITQIDYTSATFPGVTASKVMSYTLVGSWYRRDTINWIIT